MSSAPQPQKASVFTPKRLATQSLSTLALAISAALAAPSVLAQAENSAESDTRTLEEVTVTATRRQESLMDVAVAVTAYTGDELEEFGVMDITYLAQSSPNTTLEVSRGTNSTLTAFIRGVGQQDPVAGFESGVGIYLDDVYLNRPQAAVMDIYDVERIEILRGPQGTLYGRNTIGGAIKYVTRRLGDDPELRMRGRVGNYNMLEFNATGSVPITDTFRIGGSFATFNRDGFGDNLNLPGLENYNKDSMGARVSAEWEPTPDLFFRIAADWTEDDSDPRHGHRLMVGGVSGAPILDNEYDTRAGLNDPKQSVEAKGYSFLGEWAMNDVVQWRVIAANRDDESWTPIDFDSLPVADLDVPALYENEQTSFELQAIMTGRTWSGVAGFYTLDADAYTFFDVILGQLGSVIGLPGLNAVTSGDVNTKTWSLFADFTFDLGDNWQASIGARQTEDKRTTKQDRVTKIGGLSPIFGGSAIPIAVTSDFYGSETFSKMTPRAGIAWLPNQDHNVYLNYSEGFKGGGFDPRGLTTAAPDLDGDGVVSEDEVFEYMKFDPEEVSSFELGWKATLMGGRMTSRLAIFLGDYKDVQVPGSIGVDSNGDGIEDTFVGITTNAGSADINGIEWEGQAILASGIGNGDGDLNLAWSLGYMDAKYNEFIDGSGEDVADQAVIQNTPDWTGSATLSYRQGVNWFGGGELSLITMLAYRGDHSQFEFPNEFLDQDAYTLWDASAVWTSNSDHWQVGLHGKNLTDERYKVAGYNFPSLGLEGNITAFYGNPRQYWLDVQYRW